MPCPSTGEKLPLVTSPTAARRPGRRRPLRGGWRPSVARPARRRVEPGGLLPLQSGPALEALRLGPRHDPTEPGLQRGDARARARGRAAAGPLRGGGCPGPRARRAGRPAPSTASQNDGATSAGHRALDAVLAGVAGAGGHAGVPAPREAGHPEAADRRRPRGRPADRRSRAVGPWTAMMARSAVTSAPPMARRAPGPCWRRSA